MNKIILFLKKKGRQSNLFKHVISFIICLTLVSFSVAFFDNLAIIFLFGAFGGFLAAEWDAWVK